MKKILGLDLGTNSIGWALVYEAEHPGETSTIIKMGVRVNPLTVDELTNFEKGKSITTNADRTLKRSARRNLQRYKLRRENLVEILKEHALITNEMLLSENSNRTTFETYRLRAKAAKSEISLGEFARVLLMINKKRGYKSNRKVKSQEEDGQLIDGMAVAKQLYEENITPGELTYRLLKKGKRYIPDFYRSDLQAELDRIWNFQQQFYPDMLTDDFKKQLAGKGKLQASKIFGRYGVYTADNKGQDKRLQAAQWRMDALSRQLTREELAFVVCDLNGIISGSSGYLGAISDRSKELYFKKQSVGEYLMELLDKDPNTSLKNRVFYRQDYLDEFNTIWENQARYHEELTEELKREIRDVIIFYQRRLKSQKGLINFCEFESRQIEVEIDGKKKVKTVGQRVIPRSSPLFQEFKIWQILNNLEVSSAGRRGKKKKEEPSLFDEEWQVSPVGWRALSQEEKEVLFRELSVKEKLTKGEALELLFQNHKELDLNYESLEGNHTQSTLLKAYNTIIELSGHEPIEFKKKNADEILKTITEIFNALGYNTDLLHFNSEDALDGQAMFRLWHLLYSFEGDNSLTGNEKLIAKISESCGFEKEYAAILAGVTFQDDYGNLSAKAIRKILPFLKEGFAYAGRRDSPDEPSACEYAGYRHSKSSLTREEIGNKVLKDRLDILPKNSLRNPVVEKILNQMVNVINAIIDAYGKPDEIRVELARELKKNAKEREKLTTTISKTTTENEEIKTMLRNEFGLSHVSRNDIIRYKLYMELKDNGFHTLYSGTYISREKLFSKEFDIEHIIPQARLFDDSFANKTLESRAVNLEKGNDTAYDYVKNKYGEAGLQEYLNKIDGLFKSDVTKKNKLKKLKMEGRDIPGGFIDRDIRDTQYIAKKAKTMLEELVGRVVSTTGTITSRLREDWQLVNVMKELNWGKFNKLGLTEVIEDRDGQRIRHIKDWTKRNDHRHHAMDALTIAFTKDVFIQYFNNINARYDKNSNAFAIEEKYFEDRKVKLPMDNFRAEAKKHLENTLISIKAKNKVVTINVNSSKKRGGVNKKQQLTPRGQLHNETVYGSLQQYVTKEEKVGSSFTEEQIMKVGKKVYREALLKRLKEFGNDPKKAFTGKNSLEKNPVWLDDLHAKKVPERVKIVTTETILTTRKAISPDLKVDKVIDVNIRKILMSRLKEYDNDPKKAFSNLDENPIWLNKEKGIAIKRVTITGISNGQALHEKRDKDGHLLLDVDGKPQPVDFVSTSNNHHVAIYKDQKGELQENVVSFFEATTRKGLGLPVIDKEYKKSEGWEFLFSMKQNEYFVFPNKETGFDPNEVDLMNPDNYSLISPRLFRVQKITKKDYFFRHHLETMVEYNNALKDITWIRCGLSEVTNILKVRVNHIGQIVSVGEY